MPDHQPRLLATDELTAADLAALRKLLDLAFNGNFDDTDWQHAMGGVHVLLHLEGEPVAHAAVVERELHIAGKPLRTGYIEAVATRPELQATGLGTRVMRAAGLFVMDHFELGALSTGVHGFYARLGWRSWQGPSSVRMPTGEISTPDADGTLMVLTATALNVDQPISCDWRPGDVW